VIQVYGNFTRGDYYSHAEVCRGVVEGLLAGGLEVSCATLALNVGSSALDPTDLQVPVGARVGAALFPRPVDVGFYVGGYPEWSQNVPLFDHPVRIALVVAEAAPIPKHWVRWAQTLDLLVVPSEWVASNYVGAGLEPGKVFVSPHGLAAAYHPPEGVQRHERRWLHVCGAPGHPDRKGTPQLIEAWGDSHGGDVLIIRCPRTYGAFAASNEVPPTVMALWKQEDAVRRATGAQVEWDDGIDPKTPLEMARYLAGFRAVVQPSRGEGFGMIPLQARAVGTLVVATATTGHSEHAHTEDQTILSQPEAPIVASGIPDGVAPVVRPEDIAAAIRTARARPVASPYPPDYYLRHTWPAATAGLVEKLHRLAAEKGITL
jgi:hypothetical protein